MKFTDFICLLVLLFPLTLRALDTQANVPVEITFTAKRAHADPFNEVTLDVTFTDATGAARKVPAFWAGGDNWKVRYASPLTGVHRWRSVEISIW